MIRAQQLGHGGECKAAVFVLGENTLARQRAQHTVQRMLQYAAFAREFRGCARTIGEPVRDAEFGGHRNRSRD